MIEYRDFSLWLGDLSLLTVFKSIEDSTSFILEDSNGVILYTVSKELLNIDEHEILRNING